MARILIVDDEPSLLKIMQFVFESAGHDVTAFGSGPEAIEGLRKLDYDAVVTDLVMPKNSGWEVLEYLKQHYRTEETAIFVLSSLNDRKTRLRALRMGVRDFIPKPFEPEELLTKVENAISLNQSKAGSISGNFKALSLGDLLQGFEHSGKTGLVEVEMQQHLGMIKVVAGKIVEAQFGRLHGSPALEYLLHSGSGFFQFHESEVTSDQPPLDLQKLLIDSAWMEDEIERRASLLTDLNGSLTCIDWVQPDAQYDEIPTQEIFAMVNEAGTLPAKMALEDRTFSPLRLRLAIKLLLENGSLKLE